MNNTVVAAFLAAASLLACTGRQPDADRVSETTGAGETEAADTLVFLPASLQRMRTTSGAVYLGNLEATIEALSEQLRDQSSATLERMLALQLVLRFQILGRLGDLEHADQLAQQSLDTLPHPATVLLKVRIDGAFHRFSDALARLDRLQTDHPELTPSVHEVRTGVLRALGRIDLSVSKPAVRPSIKSMSEVANKLVDQGRLNEALVRFHLAQGAYQGVNPFPLAFLHSQIGIAYLRYGHLDNARLFLEAALARLPGLLIARDHLAETHVRLGNTETAIEMYRQLVESTGDPEFCGVLEGLFEEKGRKREQSDYRQCARAGFESRLADHPEAYWYHAAEYFMARGETALALELATLNTQQRSDSASLVQIVRIVYATGESSQMCQFLLLLRNRGLNPPELAELNLSVC